MLLPLLQYQLEASFVEIYNETLRDLLAPPTQEVKLEIRLDPSKPNEVHVTNLSSVLVTSESQVWNPWKHEGEGQNEWQEVGG